MHEPCEYVLVSIEPFRHYNAPHKNIGFSRLFRKTRNFRRSNAVQYKSVAVCPARPDRVACARVFRKNTVAATLLPFGNGEKKNTEKFPRRTRRKTIYPYVTRGVSFQNNCIIGRRAARCRRRLYLQVLSFAAADRFLRQMYYVPTTFYYYFYCYYTRPGIVRRRERDCRARATFVCKYIFLGNPLCVVFEKAGSMRMDIALGCTSKDVTMCLILVVARIH